MNVVDLSERIVEAQPGRCLKGRRRSSSIGTDYMLFQFISFCLYTLLYINISCGHSLLTMTKNIGTVIGTSPSSYEMP